jgi:hypothetical protein
MRRRHARGEGGTVERVCAREASRDGFIASLLSRRSKRGRARGTRPTSGRVRPGRRMARWGPGAGALERASCERASSQACSGCGRPWEARPQGCGHVACVRARVWAALGGAASGVRPCGVCAGALERGVAARHEVAHFYFIYTSSTAKISENSNKTP